MTSLDLPIPRQLTSLLPSNGVLRHWGDPDDSFTPSGGDSLKNYVPLLPAAWRPWDVIPEVLLTWVSPLLHIPPIGCKHCCTCTLKWAGLCTGTCLLMAQMGNGKESVASWIRLCQSIQPHSSCEKNSASLVPPALRSQCWAQRKFKKITHGTLP